MKDISGKIDPAVVEVVSLLNAVAEDLVIPYFMVGAKARDLFFSALFGIPTLRGTMDVDFAVRVKDWQQFEGFAIGLLATGKVQSHGKISHRFKHENGTLIDVIPFSGIENPRGTVSWPPSGESVLSTIGFEDAFKSAEVVRIALDPPCDVKICTPAGLAIMKLVSWDQKYPERSDDAKDIHYILTNYIDAGNEDRLYGPDKDIAQSEDFDFSMASPCLLGRDIAAIAGQETLSEIVRILDNETRDDSQFRLAQDMLRNQTNRGDLLENTIGLLKEMRRGILEGKTSRGQ